MPIRRILISFIVTLALFIGVYNFLAPTPPKIIISEVKSPIALVYDNVNDVQRKKSEALIWENIVSDEELFQNDMIRTSGDSTAKVKFIEDKTILNVDPNSMFIINTQSEKLGIEIITGDLMIDNKSGKSLEIFSGNSKVAMNQGTINITKHENRPFSVEVIQGVAKAIVNGKEHGLKTNERGSISGNQITTEKILLHPLAPTHLESVYLDQNQSYEFSWKKDQNIKSTSLLLGSGPDNLSEQAANIKGDRVKIQLRPGLHFWKLVSKGDQQLIESKVMQTTFLPSFSPEPIKPALGSTIFAKPDQKIQLTWRATAKNATYELTVSKDKEFKEISFFKNDIKVNSFDFDGVIIDQNYFWKVRSFLNQSSIVHESRPSFFKVKKFQKIRPPELATPLNNDSKLIEVNESNKQLFSWEKIEDATAYEITLINQAGEKIIKEIDSPQFIANDLNYGVYQWKVRSIYEDRKFSNYSETRKYELKRLPEIGWKMENKDYYYASEHPIEIKWEPIINLKHYVLEIKSLSQMGTPIKTILKRNTYQFIPPRKDTYILSVESIRTDNLISARSKTLTLDLKDFPRLKAPTFRPAEGIYNANGQGDVDLPFLKTEGATYYLVEIKNQMGETILIKKVESSPIRLNKLMPGKYTLFLKGVDFLDRPGNISLGQTVLVKNESNLPTPTIKRIRIR